MVQLLHKTIAKLTQFISKIHSPWTRKKCNYYHVLAAKEKLKVGDIIVTRTKGELSTILIPGFWKHVAVYVGNGRIVDATTKGVSYRYLEDLIMSSDFIAILSPTIETEEIRQRVADFSIAQIGKSYDFGLNSHDIKELYCSELVRDAYNSATGCLYLDLRDRMGLETITPDDLYLAKKKFIVLWEKR